MKSPLVSAFGLTALVAAAGVRAMATGAEVTIQLTRGQIATVVRRAAEADALVSLHASIPAPDQLRRFLSHLQDDKRYSHGTLQAMRVLAALPADGSRCHLTDVAASAELGRATAHRYLSTWAAIGVVVQDPASRGYARKIGTRTKTLRGGS
jgi:hypothetical protein